MPAYACLTPNILAVRSQSRCWPRTQCSLVHQWCPPGRTAQSTPIYHDRETRRLYRSTADMPSVCRASREKEARGGEASPCTKQRWQACMQPRIPEEVICVPAETIIFLAITVTRDVARITRSHHFGICAHLSRLCRRPQSHSTPSATVSLPTAAASVFRAPKFSIARTSSASRDAGQRSGNGGDGVALII
eukprot:SAG31_NODE_7800_length_1594_cov_1.788629_2_plen_191_part_00